MDLKIIERRAAFLPSKSMKTYWSIPGPGRSFPHLDCIAFDKLDGSNLRFEWSRKRGWWKFGTRRRLFDVNDPEFGQAIGIFLAKYGDDLVAIFTSKRYRGTEKAVVFCEFYGPRSFAGWHHPDDVPTVTMIDVAVHKKGIVLPRDFVDDFGHLEIPSVVYEGKFGKQFVEDVREGRLSGMTGEGVVAKGVNVGKKKSPQHGLWMRKVKTRWWLEELKKRAVESPELRHVLEENWKEQCDSHSFTEQ